MSIPSNTPDLTMVVVIRDDDHFQSVNDFICFERHKVRDFEWAHPFTGPSTCSIEFFNLADALIFKLTHG